jgi:serine phosphatase RsbU (regulator of sigma subunit)/FixJ family two-component response regulator/anti-sigma regulatory factor (Ser/Thr protein kinase)
MTTAPIRILVVDDDAALLQALPETLHLRMPESAVDTADSAAAALECIASKDYDAIVTDIKMPGVDGLELLGRIREVQPDTPALVITGHGEHDLAIQSLRAGAFDYVQKPIDREYFIASLHRAVHARALRRQVVEQQQALQRRAAALEQVVETRTEELRYKADRARVLAESAAAIHSARDVVQILQSVADAACRLADASVAAAGCAAREREAGPANHRSPEWKAAFATRPGATLPNDDQMARALAACANRHGAGLGNGHAPALGPELPWSLAVPMRSRGGDLRGGIILGRHGPPPCAEDEDLQLKVGILVRQAEVALENVLLYQRERTIAETLQRSLLPGELPQIPGLALDARYLPGRPDAVGGDWYDVFMLPSGQLGLAMGDVAGRGVWAAAVMGQLRNALRAFALEGDPPALVAARLNRFIPTGTMATLLYMVYDPDTMEARYVNLGHVPPVVVTPERTTSFLEGGAPPLGAKLWFSYRENSAVLTPGSTIVLYTDGLVETRGEPIDDGLNRLARAIADKSNDDIAGLLDHLLASVGGGTNAEDDIAVLALRPLPLDSTRLSLRLPAVPSSLSQLRQTLRRWLTASGLAADLAYEITTACNEACANAIEHAYGPGDASLSLEVSLIDGRLTVIVLDTGRWRTPHPLHRGLGLTIMRALMDTVDVDSGPGGTTVRMQRRVATTARV